MSFFSESRIMFSHEVAIWVCNPCSDTPNWCIYWNPKENCWAQDIACSTWHSRRRKVAPNHRCGLPCGIETVQWTIPSKWRFPEMGGYPQIIPFNRIFPYKPSIIGYPHFRKPPYGGFRLDKSSGFSSMAVFPAVTGWY